MDAAVNIGGATLDEPELLKPLVENLEETEDRIIIVTGGGEFVDELRSMDESYDLPPELCHWEAIRCMGVTGRLLASLSPRFVAVESEEEVENAWEEGMVPVLLTHDLLEQEDPLPESWDVTSDAISAWVASFFDMENVVLLKRVEGIERDGETVRQISAESLQEMDTDVVDQVFPEVLEEGGLQGVVVSAEHPERVEAVLGGNFSEVTVVKGR